MVDGKLDDPAWQRARPVQLRLTDTGEAPRQPTTVRALWDEKPTCTSPSTAPTTTSGRVTSKHDSNIFKEEVVEVFINENSDGKSYVELEVSPNNTVLDMYILNPGGGGKIKGLTELRNRRSPDRRRPGRDARATPPPRVPRTTGGGRWRSPSRSISSSWPPTTRRARATACAGTCIASTAPAKGFGPDEYSAWSPTGKINYHMPERFGWLILAK